MTYTNLKELFKAICDAIRSKDGTTTKINHQDIPERIKKISGGSSGVDTSDATATAKDIKKGITAYANGRKLTGTHVCETSEIEASSKAELYLWEKGVVDGNYSLTETEETDLLLSQYSTLGTSNPWDTVDYSDEINYSDGGISLINPTSILLDSKADADLLLGKYIYINEYYRIPSDATMTYVNSTYSSTIKASTAYKLNLEAVFEPLGYVVTTSSSSYPTVGEQGDYYYKYQGTLE